jgi:hypothetical protein
MRNRSQPRRQWQIRFVCVAIFAAWTIGCAGPGPRLLPADPQETRKLPDGSVQRWYVTGKGAPDYYEQLSPEGRIVAIGYTHAASSGPTIVKLDEVPQAERRELVILLDSTPYAMAREFWDAGKFRLFPRPSRTISPFPVMTDVSFAEFFGVSPMPGVESEYYDGKRLTDGANVYASGAEAGWERYSDYHLTPLLHPEAYLWPYPWLGHEYRAFEDIYLKRSQPMTVVYSVGTSSVGASQGRYGHEIALTQADQLTRYLLFMTRGRTRFTMLSDHGHDFYPPKGVRIPLADEFKRLGYRPGTTLRRPGDVVVPEFGMVSCGYVYTQSAAKVAKDALEISGVELSAYMDGETLVVQRADGLARIQHSPKGFRYVAETGDPLELKPILARLATSGGVDGEGYVDDRLLFDATADATYPDGVARLWRAFHGLVEHPPEVLLSHANGYYSGSLTMERLLTLVGIHGSLRQVSSSGFAMTMAGPLPQVMRQADLRQHLRQLGVPVPGAEQKELTGGNGGNRVEKPA